MKKKKQDEWELSDEQYAELKDTLADLKDKTRWMISDDMFGTGWHMLYCVKGDTFLMHHGRKPIDLDQVTVFKREDLAKKVIDWLYARREEKGIDKGLELVKCKIMRDRKRVRILPRGTGT